MLSIKNINYWTPTITFIEKFHFSFPFDVVHIFAIPPFVHYVRIKLLMLWGGFLGSRGSEHYHKSGKGKQPSDKKRKRKEKKYFHVPTWRFTVVSLFFSAQIQYPFYLHESIASYNPYPIQEWLKFNMVPDFREETCRVNTRRIVILIT